MTSSKGLAPKALENKINYKQLIQYLFAHLTINYLLVYFHYQNSKDILEYVIYRQNSTSGRPFENEVVIFLAFKKI